MACLDERYPENAPGDFFVDRTCIDCTACQQLAPETFVEGGGFSFVARQPATDEQRLRALRALVACPTASIGTVSRASAKPALDTFPELLADGVYLCGLTSERSFGGWSYLVRPATPFASLTSLRMSGGGNVLVDSPRAAEPLLRRMSAWGGISLMLLTHKDDIADHAKIHARFGCPRVMHEADAPREIETKLTGTEPVELFPGMLAIPVPGHTRGSLAFLWRDTFLFTGDHLAWDPEEETLEAFEDYCWYDWPTQVRSLERLLDHRFEWVLPGHGWRHHAPAAVMRAHLERLVARLTAEDR